MMATETRSKKIPLSRELLSHGKALYKKGMTSPPHEVCVGVSEKLVTLFSWGLVRRAWRCHSRATRRLRASSSSCVPTAEVCSSTVTRSESSWAEDRRLSAAIGARLPQITLDFTPSYTWLKAEIEGAVDPITGAPLGVRSAYGWTWNAGAHFSVPVFDGLRGWSAIKTQRAVADQLLEQYAEIILMALLEVESSLTLERQERLRIQYLEDEFRLANITLEATRDRYRAGLSDFLPVLTALATRQISELQLVSSRRQLVSYRVQLYRALGGAWPEEFGEPDND